MTRSTSGVTTLLCNFISSNLNGILKVQKYKIQYIQKPTQTLYFYIHL